MPDTARGTFERVRGREPRALSELATLHGRSLVGVAFAVLQNLPAAERAAAAAIAECWRRAPEAWPRDPDHLRDDLLAAAARAALAAHGDVGEVDPTPRPGASELLELDPPQRATAAIHALGGTDQRGDRSPPRIEAAVRANVAGLPVSIAPEAIRAALLAPSPAQKADRRRPLLLAAGVAAAGLLAVLATLPAPATNREMAVEQPTPAASVAEPGSMSGGQVTLADCGIGPPDAALAFSGWTTPRRLGLSSAELEPGRAVLALVPEDVVAWNPPGGPRIMPPVRGRMACLSDTTDGTLVVVGLPSGWMPPFSVPRFPGGPIEGPDGGPRSSDTG